MSKAYRETFNDGINTPERVKAFVAKKGKRDEEGKPVYTTEQSHEPECNINSMLYKYKRTGIMPNMATVPPIFGEMTGITLKEAMDRINTIKTKFMELPAELRDKFDNDPGKVLDFLSDEKNKDEALKLGIRRSDWNYDQPKTAETTP